MPETGLVKLPGDVRDELLIATLFLSLADGHVRADVDNELHCTDASPDGFGACSARCPRKVLRHLYQMSRHRGESGRLDWDGEDVAWERTRMPRADDLPNDLFACLKWRVTQGGRFPRTAHINLQEARSLKLEVLRKFLAAPLAHRIHQRRVMGLDSRVTVGAASKGRSSSYRLNGILRGFTGVLVCSRLSCAYPWVATDRNPSDHPSRDNPLPPPMPLTDELRAMLGEAFVKAEWPELADDQTIVNLSEPVPFVVAPLDTDDQLADARSPLFSHAIVQQQQSAVFASPQSAAHSSAAVATSDAETSTPKSEVKSDAAASPKPVQSKQTPMSVAAAAEAVPAPVPFQFFQSCLPFQSRPSQVPPRALAPRRRMLPRRRPLRASQRLPPRSSLSASAAPAAAAGRGRTQIFQLFPHAIPCPVVLFFRDRSIMPCGIQGYVCSRTFFATNFVRDVLSDAEVSSGSFVEAFAGEGAVAAAVARADPERTVTPLEAYPGCEDDSGFGAPQYVVEHDLTN